MARLRYRWGEGEAQDSPVPPDANTLALLVGECCVWAGDIAAELSAWARRCALEVVDLWDCPEVVHRYLQTGEEALREATTQAAEKAALTVASAIARDAAYAALLAAAGDAPNAAASALACAATSADALAAAKTQQTSHLRALLLRRALPEHSHALLDDEAHEAVLADALLETARG